MFVCLFVLIYRSTASGLYCFWCQSWTHCYPLYVTNYFSFVTFKVFLFAFGSQQFSYVGHFMSILLVVCWASWMYRLIYILKIKLGKFLVIISSNFLSVFLFLFSPSGTPIIRVDFLDVTLQVSEALFILLRYSFSFCSSSWSTIDWSALSPTMSGLQNFEPSLWIPT